VRDEGRGFGGFLADFFSGQSKIAPKTERISLPKIVERLTIPS
jgi:hypothetical protein